MVNFAPLDYERYLALVGPVPVVDAVAAVTSRARHVEELPQITRQMHRWHEFSAEGEIERLRLAQQAGRPQAVAPALEPVHVGPNPNLAWSVVNEAAGQIGGGERLNAPLPQVAASLYRPVTEAPPPAIDETA